jgi:hypothetical protein
MNETPPQNQPPAPQAQPPAPPPPAQPVTTTTPPAEPKKRSSKSPFLFAFLAFFVGIGVGYVLILQFPGSKVAETPNDKKVTAKALPLPGDAIKVQACVEQKGELHAKASDLPQGPIYMVDNDKVVGLEYVMNQNDFAKGKVYENLNTYNSLVDHMQVATMSADYNGKSGTYYVVDLYFVDKKTQARIGCTVPSPETPDASASAEVSTFPTVAPTEGQVLTPAIAIPSSAAVSPVPNQ